MLVDVLTEIVIQRPRAVVAQYAADPNHAPDWYVNIKSVEWKTSPRGTARERIQQLRTCRRPTRGNPCPTRQRA